MVKGWILDLPIIPQPIVFLCIVLTAQPTLSWSLSDLDQWAHFSQYRGLCQQRLHILIVMCCKHQKSKMKRIFYLKLKTWRHSNYWRPWHIAMYCKYHESKMKGYSTPNWNIWRHSNYWMATEPGGTRKVDTALAFWSIPMTCNCHDEECKRTRPPFYHETLYNAPCGRWPIDHGLCRSQTMLNKRQGKPDQDFHCSQKQSITGAG